MLGKRPRSDGILIIDEKNERYQQKPVGLGSTEHAIGIYIGNRPNYPSINELQSLRLAKGAEVEHIIAQTGNHWRKVFSICAKIGFSLWPEEAARWQDYRDQILFRRGGQLALLFSAPPLGNSQNVKLVLGKQYAEQCVTNALCTETLNGFLVNPQQKLIQTPYFDYRQLSNQRLEELLATINALSKIEKPVC